MGNVVNLKKNTEDSAHMFSLAAPLSFSVSKRHKFKTRLIGAAKGAYGFTIRRFLDWCDRIESTRLLGVLMTTSIRLNRESFHVETEYNGGFNRVTCFAYLGGHRSGKHPVRIIVGQDHDRTYRGNLKPKNIRKAIKALKDISRFNDLYCDRYHGHI